MSSGEILSQPFSNSTTYLQFGFRDKIKDEPVIDEPEDRIVGGTDVDISERPFQIVFLYYGSLRCGGSWIGGNAVLTAAHCCDGVSASSVSVRVGSSRYSSGGDVSFRISFNFFRFFHYFLL